MCVLIHFVQQDDKDDKQNETERGVSASISFDDDDASIPVSTLEEFYSYHHPPFVSSKKMRVPLESLSVRGDVFSHFANDLTHTLADFNAKQESSKINSSGTNMHPVIHALHQRAMDGYRPGQQGSP